MAAYQVENQWGGSQEPWHQGSTWLIGGRNNQLVVAIDISSNDNGQTLNGNMTYKGEGPIDFRGTWDFANYYKVEVRWGGSDAPWHSDGNWVIGGRDNQRCIQLKATATNDNKELSGVMTYEGEGEIGFKGILTSSYEVENQWGGSSAPWHAGGVWVLSGRSNQNVVNMDIVSSDKGQTFEGTMTYEGEGPIGFKGKLAVGNTYEVSNQWGGPSAEWHRGGDLIIGGRRDQRVVQLKFTSEHGEFLNGNMTYDGEGPIGFKADMQLMGQLTLSK